MISYHLIARQCKHIGSTVSCSSVSCVLRFFSSRLFAAIGCPGVFFTGQVPGIGTVFILACLQKCKVQRQVQRQNPPTNQGGCGGRQLASAGVAGVVRGGQ